MLAAFAPVLNNPGGAHVGTNIRPMFPYRTNIEGKWVSPIAIGRAGTWLYTWFEQATWHCGLATFEQQWKIPSVRVEHLGPGTAIVRT